jgi:hypothetical protein
VTRTCFKDCLEFCHGIAILLRAEDVRTVAIVPVECAVASHCEVLLVEGDRVIWSRSVVVHDAPRGLQGRVAFVREFYFFRIVNYVVSCCAVTSKLTKGESEARLAIHSIYFVVFSCKII